MVRKGMKMTYHVVLPLAKSGTVKTVPKGDVVLALKLLDSEIHDLTPASVHPYEISPIVEYDGARCAHILAARLNESQAVVTSLIFPK